MTEERVARNTHTMVQRLEDLRNEHMTLISSLDSPKAEKSDIILKNIKSIDIGLDEAQLMMEFTMHLQNVEIEKQKLVAQVNQLSQDNDDLKVKLAATQKKLRMFEEMVTECENRNEIEGVGNDEQNLEIETPNDSVSDDYDSDTSTVTPNGTNRTAYVNNDESEALSRFKSLQCLAIHYASEGKFEVALPLCEQAVDDLEKTTIGRFHPYVTRMMSMVGLVYGVQNQYKEATKCLHDAIREKTQHHHATFESL